ncbi:MAG: tetratricopeptide repeat protein [Candidatus Eremiobacterota bacterium]
MNFKRIDIRLFLSLFIILLITFISFLPVINAGLTNWDDDQYITGNKGIRNLSPENIKEMFNIFFDKNVPFHQTLYTPLVHLSYGIEYHFFGFNPSVNHITNLVLHLINTMLVFCLIFMITEDRGRSFLVSMFFGIHPVHVESVAWISERKDVLYSFFYLLSLIAYTYYQKKHGTIYYYFSLFLFLLSLLSKPMAMTLPFILLLFDYFKNRRFNKYTILEKIPYFILSGLCVVIIFTIGSQVKPDEDVKALGIYNIFIASYGIMLYIYKFLLPLRLSAIYPHLEWNKIPVIFWISPVIIFLTLGLVIYSGKYTGKIIFGFMFFFISILPVSQIITLHPGIINDRYMYISSLGLLYLFSEGFFLLYERKKISSFITAILVVIIMSFSFLTAERCKVWKDSLSLWNDVLSKYPGAVQAYANRGNIYRQKGEYNKALSDFTEALRLKPFKAEFYATRGSIYTEIKEYDRAMADLNYSLKLKPDLAGAYLNRGNLYRAKGEYNKAISDYTEALKLKPDYAEVYYNRALVYDVLKDYNKSLADYSMSVEYKPDYAEALYNRAIVYDILKDYDKAIADFTGAIEYKSDYVEAYQNRGNIYYKTGMYDNALNDFNQLLTIDPDFAGGYISRGTVYIEMSRFSDALIDFNKAIELDSHSVEALNGRGTVYGLMNYYERAIDDFTEALSVDKNSVQSYYNRAFTYMKKGDFKQAREDVKKLEASGYKVDKSVFKEIY